MAQRKVQSGRRREWQRPEMRRLLSGSAEGGFILGGIPDGGPSGTVGS
jgi:hypothetical protein